MKDIQKASEVKRPETGPLQFDGDWPGVFIRGDDALGILGLLSLLKTLDIATNEHSFRGMLDRIESIVKQCAVTDRPH